MIDFFNIKPIDILHVEPIGQLPPSPSIRVIGGTTAPRNSIPYQAALIINNSGFCGGSLISPEIVLTAAHCVDSATQTQVILGAHSPLVNEATQSVQVSTKHIVHQNWIRLFLQNDVALVRISKVTLNHAIQLIALAPTNAPSYAGSVALLSGWGLTSDSSNSIASELQRVDLTVIDHDLCRSVFGIILGAQHICTSGQGIVGACNGDSGGPLVIGGTQVGVVSFGSNLCEAQNPTAFARVSHFRNWITEHAGI